MVAGSGPQRSGRGPALRIVAAGVAVVALSAAILLQALPAGPARPSASPAAAGTANPAGSMAPSVAPSGDWAALTLPPLDVAADLRASAEDLTGIDPNATFGLTSRTSESARALAARLEVAPAAALDVIDGTDASAVTLRPTSALTAGETYRFELRGADGSVAGSWAFHVRGPINVTTTIPGDATTQVPVRTGIEVTFDQDDVADMADHFSIVPAVDGTFQRHGRAQVFVPSVLEPSTTYTVTIRKGLARTGTDLVLERDVVFRFETNGPPPTTTRLGFGRDVLEASPGLAPVVAVRLIRPNLDDEDASATTPSEASVRVYRLASLDAAAAALRDFLAAPRWTEFGEPRIATDGLELVTSFTAPLQTLTDQTALLRFPTALAPGRYVVELGGDRPADAFLQVTRVSAWVSVLTDRTVVWVNDVVDGAAIRGATVAVETAPAFAAADAEGLAVGPTPSDLVPPAASGDDAPRAPILRIRSGKDVLLVPFDVAGAAGLYRGEWSEKVPIDQTADETYWALLSTDRGVYRRTDRIEAWGYVRARDDGQVPATVQLRLVRNGAGRDTSAPAIAAATVEPVADGSFVASLPIREATTDSYELQALVDGRVVVARWLDVTVIRKPAYALEIDSNHTAVIRGSKVTWTVTGAFFDGTPTGGLGLNLTGDQFPDGIPATTDAEGRLVVTRTVNQREGGEDPSSWSLDARPSGPESAEIWATDSITVFPASWQITGDGAVSDGRLRVTADLHEVDLARVERAIARGAWDGDAAGDPIAGRSIAVRIVELVPVRTRVGSEYDPISKTVQPVYRYETERRALRTLHVTSNTAGQVAFSAAIPNVRHGYEAVLSLSDPAGRLVQRTIGVSAAQPTNESVGAVFRETDGKLAGERSYSVGERIFWRLVEGGQAAASGGADRYLYLVAQRGLRTATVSRAPTFRRTFAEADAPGIFVIGVHFTGSTYTAKAATWANLDPRDRAIRVTVAANKPSYRPGEVARLTIRTTDTAGTPIAAGVVVQAVDEKLYAMGGASTPDPLGELYRRVDSGILRLTATHQLPTGAGPEGEGGDATGGEPRSDFRDTLLFAHLETGPDGQATIEANLSDDLTSWHVAAMAVTADLRAGVGERLIRVGLPFFVEATVADSYLVSDQPAIQLRSYGSSLQAGDAVDYRITVLDPTGTTTRLTAHGGAFTGQTVKLPSLVRGTTRLTIEASTDRRDSAGERLHDGLTRTFDVVQSRLTALETASSLVADGLPAAPAGAERLTWTFADAGRGRVLPTLVDLANPAGIRLDRSLAQSLARSLLIKAFGRDAAALPPDGFDSGRYAIGTREDENDGTITAAGAGLLPTAGLDPWLAVRVALLAPDAVDRESLRDALVGIAALPDVKRDLEIAALAGRAGIGEPVLPELQAARAQPDLSPSELVYLALGFEAVGDDPAAIAIERQVLGTQGEQLGALVRVRFGTTADGADANALLSVVAAGIGDPLAAGLATYAEANPPADSLNALELVAYAGRWVERTPAAPASFAITVDGTRTVVDLAPGAARSVSLTPAQSADLRVEVLRGSVLATVEGRVPTAAASITPHESLALTRSAPASPLPADRLVTVDLEATFTAAAPDGCYDVVELVPSGLAPLSIASVEADESGVVWPSSVVGQEVRFCAANDAATGHAAHLRYVARIVGEGSYTWEPAVIQRPDAPEMVAITPSTTIAIGR